MAHPSHLPASPDGGCRPAGNTRGAPWLARACVGLGLSVVAAIGPSCSSDSGSRSNGTRQATHGSVSSSSITELHLFGNPVAMNLDGLPGPDGIGIRIYASTPAKAQGVVIRQGTLEIRMYDGTVGAGDVNAQPRKVWTFTPAELRKYASQSSLGVGYDFALPWGETRPVQPRLTVIARLTQPKKGVITSDANSVSVEVR